MKMMNFHNMNRVKKKVIPQTFLKCSNEIKMLNSSEIVLILSNHGHLREAIIITLDLGHHTHNYQDRLCYRQ